MVLIKCKQEIFKNNKVKKKKKIERTNNKISQNCER